MSQLVVLNYETGCVDFISISAETMKKCEDLDYCDWLVYERFGYSESNTNYMIADNDLPINHYKEEDIPYDGEDYD